MVDFHLRFTASNRALTDQHKKFAGQCGESEATTLRISYDPLNFIESGGYTPYIIFDVGDREQCLLTYGPMSSPCFDGYSFPIPWEVTSRMRKARLEFQLFFVKPGTVVNDINDVPKLSPAQYVCSSISGIALKPSKMCHPHHGDPMCHPPNPGMEPSMATLMELLRDHSVTNELHVDKNPYSGLIELHVPTLTHKFDKREPLPLAPLDAEGHVDADFIPWMDSWASATDSQIPSARDVKVALDQKVDKGTFDNKLDRENVVNEWGTPPLSTNVPSEELTKRELDGKAPVANPIPYWDGSTQYEAGSLVRLRANNRVYRAVEPNVGQAPDSTSVWRMLYDSSDLGKTLAEAKKTADTLESLQRQVDTKASQEEVDGLSTKVGELESSKADQTALDDLKAEMDTKALQSEVDALSATVDLKADKTQVDALESVVDTKAPQTELDALKAEVATKADQSDYDALQQEVATKADQDAVDKLSEEVATKADESELENKLDREQLVNEWIEEGSDALIPSMAIVKASLDEKTGEEAIIDEWSEVPQSNRTPSERLVVDALDQKTDKSMAIPLWDAETNYFVNSTVIYSGSLYISKHSGNKGNTPIVNPNEDWEAISLERGGSSGGCYECGNSRVYTQEIQSDEETQFDIFHNLGTKNVFVNVRMVGGSRMYVKTTIKAMTDAMVRVRFKHPPKEPMMVIITAAMNTREKTFIETFPKAEDVGKKEFSFYHNYGTFNVFYQIRETYPDGDDGCELVDTTAEAISPMELKLTFAEPPKEGEYTIYIMPTMLEPEADGMTVTFAEPSDTWIINHGQHRIVAVYTVDLDGYELQGYPQNVIRDDAEPEASLNRVIVRFSEPVAGYAYVR